MQYKSDWLKRIEQKERKMVWVGGFVVGSAFGIILMLLVNVMAYVVWANNFIAANGY